MRLGPRSNIVGAVLLAGAVVAAMHSPAAASHFRYGKITWTTAGGNTIEFTIDNSWRRSAYTSGNNRCRNVFAAGLPRENCAGPGTAAGLEDNIVELQGNPGTTFNPGQGSAIGSPLGALLYYVSTIDPTSDWLIGTALDPASLPASGPLDTLVSKTYTGLGNYTAFINTCCRLEASAGHVNNPEGDYRLETLVNVGTGNRSPVTSMPPIVQCPVNGICAFNIPATDPDNDPIRFRLATAAEAGSGFVQPGPPDAPSAATINATSGQYTWNTTGAELDSPVTLYSTQVIIEDLTGPGGSVKSKIPVDFFIQLTNQAGIAPSFSQPACGTTVVADPDVPIAFDVTASDPDSLQILTLNVSGLPSGATMTDPLPIAGNPASSVFAWAPTAAQAGSYVVNFTATDDANVQTLCDIRIEVAGCTDDAQCEDGMACTTDSCQPDHPNANAGGCVNAPVVCVDACQTCNPGSGLCDGPLCTPPPTATHTPTPTPTNTPTATNSATHTFTGTPAPTPTHTPTGSATVTPTPTDTAAPTVTNTAEPTATATVQQNPCQAVALSGCRKPCRTDKRTLYIRTVLNEETGNAIPHSQNRFTYEWRRGAVEPGQYGDLTDALNGPRLTFCVYQGATRTRVMSVSVGPGEEDWTKKTIHGFDTFKYKNGSAAADGIKKMRLVEGILSQPPDARIVVKAQGENIPVDGEDGNLPLPAAEDSMRMFDPPVLVQVQKSDPLTNQVLNDCWESEYAEGILTNSPTEFKAINYVPVPETTPGLTPTPGPEGCGADSP